MLFSLPNNNIKPISTTNRTSDDICSASTSAMTKNEHDKDEHVSYVCSIGSESKRTVRFGTVSILEYGLTVGAQAADNDTCPLQLTREYSSCETYLQIDAHQRTSPSFVNTNVMSGDTTPCRPRRLSNKARRRRIASVQGTRDVDIVKMEYDVAMAMIQDTFRWIEELEQNLSEVRTVSLTTHSSQQWMLTHFTQRLGRRRCTVE